MTARNEAFYAAEKKVLLLSAEEVFEVIPNIGGRIACAHLRQRGWYSCVFDGVKLFIEVSK